MSSKYGNVVLFAYDSTIVRDVWFTGDHDLIQYCCKEAAQTQVSGVIFLIRLPLSVYINRNPLSCPGWSLFIQGRPTKL